MKVRKRSTEDETNRRIRWVEDKLRTRPMLKSKMRSLIQRKFGVEWRMADEYIRRAKNRLLMSLDQTKAQHRADSIAFYESIILSKKSTPGEKVRARERIDKLLGLDQPTQIYAEVTARPKGINVAELPLEERKRLLHLVRSTAIDVPTKTDEEDEEPW